MSHRNVLVLTLCSAVLSLSLFVVSPVFADGSASGVVGWEGPGYYGIDLGQQEDCKIAAAEAHAAVDCTVMGIVSGPFSSKAGCESSVSAYKDDNPYALVDCVYASTKSDWNVTRDAQ